jgi:hypothetical protein
LSVASLLPCLSISAGGPSSSNVVKDVFIVTPRDNKGDNQICNRLLAFGIYPFYILLAIMLLIVKKQFCKITGEENGEKSLFCF